MDFGQTIPLNRRNQIAKAGIEDFKRMTQDSGASGPAAWEPLEGHASLGAKMLARRFLTGKLDAQDLAHRAVDAIGTLLHGGELDEAGKVILTALAPEKWEFMPRRMAEVQLGISDSEKEEVRSIVAAKLAEIENWNAGAGGGSVEGRSWTVKAMEGPGSLGGRVLGRTQSGKPIYATHEKEWSPFGKWMSALMGGPHQGGTEVPYNAGLHTDFTSADHADAEMAHRKHAETYKPGGKHYDPGWGKINDIVSAHHEDAAAQHAAWKRKLSNLENVG